MAKYEVLIKAVRMLHLGRRLRPHRCHRPGHNDHATVIDATTGEILTEHTVNPTHTYQPKNG